MSNVSQLVRPVSKEREREMMRALTRYRDTVLNGATDESILTLAGGGRKQWLWLVPPEMLEREISKALGKIERERYGAFVPEWCVESHNVLCKAFALHVIKHPMPGNLY